MAINITITDIIDPKLMRGLTKNASKIQFNNSSQIMIGRLRHTKFQNLISAKFLKAMTQTMTITRDLTKE